MARQRRKPPRSKNETQRTQLEAEAWKLRIEGYTQHQIAARLGVNQSSVCKALHRVNARELAALAEIVAAEKVGQYERLCWLYSEAVREWERSKQPRKRVIKKTDSGEDGAEVLSYETVESFGNPAYLTLAMAILRDIRSLFGLDVQAAAQEPITTAAEIAARLHANAIAHEAETAAEAARTAASGGGEGAGTGAVQAGSGQVQPGDPGAAGLLGATEGNLLVADELHDDRGEDGERRG